MGNDDDAEREVHLSLRLTGREVYRAVKNFIKQELKFDPKEHQAAVRNEVVAEARKTVRETLTSHFSKPADIEWIARSEMAKTLTDDLKKSIRDEIRYAAVRVVAEEKKRIEAAVRAELEANGSEVIAALIHEALSKASAK